jgi:hypothetical protein
MTVNRERSQTRTFPLNAHRVDFRARASGSFDGDRRCVPTAQGALGGLDVRLQKALSIVAASLIALAPFQASAQEAQSVSVRNRPRPEYDPLGLRFGGFDLNARVDIGLVHVDNLFGTQTNAQSDTAYTIAPQARLASHWSRNALYFDLGLEHDAYSKFSDQNVTTGFLDAGGRLDLGQSTQVSASAGYARRLEPRTDPDALDAGKPVQYDVSNESLSASHEFTFIHVSATGGHTVYTYHNAGPISQSFRDYTQNEGVLKLEYPITPRIGIVGQATVDHRNYDNSPATSSTGQTYLVGAHINITDLVQGQIAVGQFQRDYHSGAHVDGAAVDANLEWYVTQLTTLSFNANRDGSEQGATTADPYIESQYGAHVDHELLRNLIVAAGLGAGKRDYRLIDRRDDFSYGEAGVDYFVNRRIALVGRYRHDEVNSKGVDRYRNNNVNTVSLGLSLRL